MLAQAIVCDDTNDNLSLGKYRNDARAKKTERGSNNADDDSVVNTLNNVNVEPKKKANNDRI